MIIGSFDYNTARKDRKVIQKQKDLMEKTLKLIPTGLEVEFYTKNGDVLISSIKEQYLTQNPNDLLRTYGNTLPGQWHILGIIDKLQANKIASSNDLRKSIDDYADIIKELYNSPESSYSITPILIFRNLSV